MFEKEAERNSKEIRSESGFIEGEYYSEGYCSGYERGFQNGAEFGYNKVKEEADDIINELLMNGYAESTRDKALNFLYPDKEKEEE